jgi:hypothetical protein
MNNTCTISMIGLRLIGLAYNLTMETLEHCDMIKETAEFVASTGTAIRGP